LTGSSPKHESQLLKSQTYKKGQGGHLNNKKISDFLTIPKAREAISCTNDPSTPGASGSFELHRSQRWKGSLRDEEAHDAVGDIFGSRAGGCGTAEAEVGDTAQNGRASEGERCRARKATHGIEGRRRVGERRSGGLEVEEERARRRRSQWRRRRLGGAGGGGADEAGRASLRPRAEGAGGPTCRRRYSETRDDASGAFGPWSDGLRC
jgi:hypothetical protein